MTGLSEPAFEKLIKLLMLTQSCTDAERLSAIKMANTLLKAASYNWEDLLRSKVVTFPVEAPDLTPPKTASERFDNAQEILPYFETIFNRQPLSPNFTTFMNSVYDWWSRRLSH
jgi:hypothetical protein